MQKTVISGKSYEYEQSFCYVPDDVGRFLMYQIGEIHCEPGYICDAHRQWCYEITYVIDGEGVNTVDDVDAKMSKGDLFLTPLNSIHKIEAVTRLKYMFIGFDIKDRDTPDCHALWEFYDAAPLDHIRGSSEIMFLFTRCFEEYYSSQPCGSLMKESLIAELLAKVMRLFAAYDLLRAPKAEKQRTSAVSIFAVRKFIDTHIAMAGNVKDVAAAFRYSSAYLSHKFKEEMGMTLREYIAHKRIEEGARLISELGMSVGEAASGAGFATPQAFCKAFKRIKGVSPKSYCIRTISAEQPGSARAGEKQ